MPTGGTGAEVSKPITVKVNDSTGGGSASGKSSGVNSSNESRNRQSANTRMATKVIAAQKNIEKTQESAAKVA